MINYLMAVMMTFSMINPQVIFDFSKDSKLDNWRIVDDIVMGGRSLGKLKINNEGHGLFEGQISLENNGGFSSVRYRCPRIPINNYTSIAVKLKGDGKNYQLRIKADSGDYYSFISTFDTSGEWQEIVIELKVMYPSFRGRKLDLPNFSGDGIEEIAFLIANKKKESFKLLIDRIELR